MWRKTDTILVKKNVWKYNEKYLFFFLGGKLIDEET